MKHLFIILILIFIVTELDSFTIEQPNELIIKELILIKNTYDFVNDNNIRHDMLRRQNKIIDKYNKNMYLDYLIKD